MLHASYIFVYLQSASISHGTEDILNANTMNYWSFWSDQHGVDNPAAPQWYTLDIS